MKTRRFYKKLVLNKKTVANLNSDEMNVVQGGLTLQCQTKWVPTCDEPYTGLGERCHTGGTDCCVIC